MEDMGELNEIGGVNHPNCRASMRFGDSLDTLGPHIPLKKFTVVLDRHTRMVRKYVWQQIARGRDYVSLVKMAKTLGLRYDQCETAITILHAERKIPRMVIVEEVEG